MIRVCVEPNCLFNLFRNSSPFLAWFRLEIQGSDASTKINLDRLFILMTRYAEEEGEEGGGRRIGMVVDDRGYLVFVGKKVNLLLTHPRLGRTRSSSLVEVPWEYNDLSCRKCVSFNSLLGLGRQTTPFHKLLSESSIYEVFQIS